MPTLKQCASDLLWTLVRLVVRCQEVAALEPDPQSHFRSQFEDSGNFGQELYQLLFCGDSQIYYSMENHTCSFL